MLAYRMCRIGIRGVVVSLCLSTLEVNHDVLAGSTKSFASIVLLRSTFFLIRDGDLFPSTTISFGELLEPLKRTKFRIGFRVEMGLRIADLLSRRLN
jgi:hypothetical protein